MAFQNLTKKELDEVAEAYSLDDEHRKTKATIIKELEFMNVTYSQWLRDSGQEENKEEVEASQDETSKVDDGGRKHLVKMTRLNPYYQVGKFTFTKEAPYNLVDEQTLDLLMSEEGFVMATPKELKEFYG